MERFTKITVTLWACAAIALQTWLLRAWPTLPWVTLWVSAIALAAGRLDRRAVTVVLAGAYVFPTIVQLVRGMQYAPFDVLWMAALLAVIAPDTVGTRWQMPARWRAALLLTALTIATSAVLSIWR